MNDAKLTGATMTCAVHELQGYTSSGWRLRSVHEQDELVLHGESGCYGPGDSYVQRSRPMGVAPVEGDSKLRRLVFVLERSRDEELEIAKGEAAMARDAKRTAERDRELALASLEEAKKETSKHVEQVKQIRDNLDRSSAELTAWRKKAQKLEADLARVRAELGDARWGEIVGAPAADAGTPYRSSGS